MLTTNWIDDYIKAGKSCISKEELEALSFHKHPKVRRRVAENLNTAAGVLERLASDPDADVRLAVGANRSTPIDVVFSLALDEDPTVRHGLAEDSNTPLGLLKRLAQDENAYVSCRAKQTLARSQSQWGKKQDSKSNVVAFPFWNSSCFAT